MKITHEILINSGDSYYTILIPSVERTRVILDEFDHKLLDECISSGKVSDLLLGLETLVRKIEEQLEREKKGRK